MELQFTENPDPNEPDIDFISKVPVEEPYDPTEGIEYWDEHLGEPKCPHGITTYFFPKIRSNPDTHYCTLTAFHEGSHVTSSHHISPYQWSTPHHTEEDNEDDPSDCPTCWAIIESNYFNTPTDTIRKAGIRIWGED